MGTQQFQACDVLALDGAKSTTILIKHVRMALNEKA